MSVIIRLQNLPLAANSIDIRTFFRGLSIPDGGVHIVGGKEGDAFIAFSTDEDARQAMGMSGTNLQGSTVRLLLSSRNEMFKVIEQARQKTLGIVPSNGVNSGTGLPGSSAPSLSGNVNAPVPNRDTATNATSSPFQSHLPQLTNQSSMSNNTLLGGPGQSHGQNSTTGLPSGTNAFGIPNMSAFTGILNNLNNNNTATPPQGINPFAAAMNNATQVPQQQQMNSMMGHGHGQGMFPQNQNSQPARGQAPNQQGFGNNTISPFGPNVSSLLSGINQNQPFSSSGLMSNPPSHMGHQQQSIQGQGQLGFPNHSMHGMGGQMGNNGSVLGAFGHGMTGQGQTNTGNSGGNLSGAFQGGMGIMGGPNNPAFPNTSHPPPFMVQNTGLGLGHHVTGAGQGDGNLGSGYSGHGGGMGIDHGNSNTGGRGRPSRFQSATNSPAQQNADEMGMGHGFQGRGRTSNADRDSRPKSGFGAFGKPDTATGTSIGSSRDRDRDSRGENRSTRRTRSRSRDRRESRRTTSSRGDRDRDRDTSRRHRRTKSKSRSRSRDRDRSRITGTRRNSSLDTKDKNSSPEKISSRHDADDSKNSSGGDDVLVISDGTEPEFPCIKVTGLPRDYSFAKIKDLLRVEFRGGNDGAVRNYDEGVAFIRLAKSSDFSKAIRQNGRKAGSSTIRIEGISLDTWDAAYNILKRAGGEREVERDSDKDRNRGRDRDDRERDRDDRERDRDHRDNRDRDFKGRDRDISSASTECSLLIRGMPAAFSPKDVSVRILGGVRKWAYSEIVIVPAQNENGRPIANAYVLMISPQEAQKAIDIIARSEEGSNLRTQVLGAEEVARAKKVNGATSGGSYKDRDSRFASGETKSLFDLNLDGAGESESSSVILRGIPPNMSERDVVDFFSDIGLTPTNVQILFDMQGSRNGQAMVMFQDSQRAFRATSKDGMAFGRNTISVQLVQRRGNHNNMMDANPFAPVGMGPRGPRGAPPGLLGIRPRFPTTLHRPRDPNPFVQAMQQGLPPRGGPRGPPRMRGMGRGGGPRGPRLSLDMNAEEANGNEDHLTVTSSFHLESLFERKGCVLAATNIPYSAGMEDILTFLNGLLEKPVSRDRIIRRYNEFQQATGDARIAFDTPYDAQKAHDVLQNSTMWNRKITVSIPSEFER